MNLDWVAALKWTIIVIVGLCGYIVIGRFFYTLWEHLKPEKPQTTAGVLWPLTLFVLLFLLFWEFIGKVVLGIRWTFSKIFFPAVDALGKKIANYFNNL